MPRRPLYEICPVCSGSNRLEVGGDLRACIVCEAARVIPIGLSAGQFEALQDRLAAAELVIDAAGSFFDTSGGPSAAGLHSLRRMVDTYRRTYRPVRPSTLGGPSDDDHDQTNQARHENPPPRGHGPPGPQAGR